MDSMRNFIKINLFLNKSKKKQNESFSFASFFAMLNRKRRNVNGKMRNVRQLRRTFLVLNPLLVLSIFRENRWMKSALLFWLLANSFLSGLQWLIYFGGEKGWLIHLQWWYYCAILLQIVDTLIVYFSFFV